MKKILLSSSILSADFNRLGEEIQSAERAGVDWIHVDVMDGDFVPNISMGPFIVETCRRITKLPIDTHLMINHPEHHIEAFAKAGAHNITIHPENNPNVHRTLQQIRVLGCHPGIALNPGTPVSAIEEVLEFVDLVLLMMVNPGFSGQIFLPQMLKKITAVQKMIHAVHSKALIEVDGGINSDTLPLAHQAGAGVFVAATAIFKYPEGIAAGVSALRDSVP